MFRAALFAKVKMETIQMPINNRMKIKIVEYSLDRMLYSHKPIQQHDTIWMNLTKTSGVKSSKSQKSHIRNNFIYIKFKTKLLSLGKHPSVITLRKRNENIINVKESTFLWLRSRGTWGYRQHSISLPKLLHYGSFNNYSLNLHSFMFFSKNIYQK